MKPLKQITAKVLLGLLFMSISITASAGIHETAEEEKTTGSFTAGADLVSSYVWRGFTQNAGPNLQPTVSFILWRFNNWCLGLHKFYRHCQRSRLLPYVCNRCIFGNNNRLQLAIYAIVL
jgi:hypothetical protein